MHETRYETIIPHLAWFAEKKFPYNPVSIIFATYSTRMEWIGLVVAVQSNDKRPNILLDEEDTRTFFSPRIFLFVRPHRCLFFIPLFLFFSPSLFFFSLFFREVERKERGMEMAQFSFGWKKKETTVRANDRARDGVSSYRFLCHLPLYVDVITISGPGRKSKRANLHPRHIPIPQIIPSTRLRRFMEFILPTRFKYFSSSTKYFIHTLSSLVSSQ